MLATTAGEERPQHPDGKGASGNAPAAARSKNRRTAPWLGTAGRRASAPRAAQLFPVSFRLERLDEAADHRVVRGGHAGPRRRCSIILWLM